MNVILTQPKVSGANRAIRATLYHLNGQKSHIYTVTPIFTDWSEPCEHAARLMDEYVCVLTRHYVQIEKYQIQVGSIKPDGQFTEAFHYPEKEIPLGMIYLGGDRGGWATPEEAKADEERRRKEL